MHPVALQVAAATFRFRTKIMLSLFKYMLTTIYHHRFPNSCICSLSLQHNTKFSNNLLVKIREWPNYLNSKLSVCKLSIYGDMRPRPIYFRQIFPCFKTESKASQGEGYKTLFMSWRVTLCSPNIAIYPYLCTIVAIWHETKNAFLRARVHHSKRV